MTWLLVGAGGALGAVLRHALNAAVHRWALASVFPWGLLLVNVMGSFGIGVIAGLLAGGRIHVAYAGRMFLVVGLLGGFTTFSSFSLDTFALWRDGHAGAAVVNAAGTLGLGLAATAAGFRLGLSV